MHISEIIDFLSEIKEAEGDIRMESITGFWIETVAETDERIIVPVVGNRQSVNDVIQKLGDTNATR